MRAGGVFVNTSSEQAADPSEDLVDYALTRAEVLNSEITAKQLAPRASLRTRSRLASSWSRCKWSGGGTAEKLQKFGSTSFLGRPGQPAEIAALYVAAADPALSFSTGQIFGATGGGGQPA